MATNSLIEGELFHKITRDERQEECRRKWIKNRCVGTIVASTGFGTVKAGHIDLIKPEYNLTLNVVANTGHKVAVSESKIC